MNIFYLDENPVTAARYHCDKHVVKMILESAQLLCTAINVCAGEQVTPYKSTHINHPCSIWVRESYSNWSYVFNLMLHLEREWQHRWGHNKFHISVSKLVATEAGTEAGFTDLAEKYLPKGGLTPPALAMPDYCKVTGNPVESYREYYRNEKQHLHKWTNREIPEWLSSKSYQH